MRSQWVVAAFWMAVCQGTALSLAETHESPGSPEQLVRSAFEAELEGDNARRLTLLTQAVSYDSACRPAHWQLGEVQDGEHWISIAHMQHRAAADPLRREYLQRRASAGNTFGEQKALARWCAKQGLNVEERYHWLLALRIEPRNSEALRALGACWHNGELLLVEESQRRQAEAVRLKSLAPKRAATFAMWRKAILQGSESEKGVALELLRAYREWEMLPVLEKELSLADETLALEVVQLLRQTPEHATTLSLTRHAVSSQWKSVRTAAAEALRERPWHDFVPLLLDALESPVALDAGVEERPDGKLAYHQRLKQEGAFADRWSVRTEINRPMLGGVARTPLGVPVMSSTFVQAAARAAEKTRREVDAYNTQVSRRNQRLEETLTVATSQPSKGDPEKWWRWWSEYEELPAPKERPLQLEWQVADRSPTEPAPQEGVLLFPGARTTERCSCFPKGTPVWTLTGLAAIELIQPGDRVLSQNVNTGELAFQPVLGITLRPSTKNLRLKFPEEEIVATSTHPFWLVGEGWRMAKEIKPSDRLHTVNGAAEVTAVLEAFESEAYNLIVADDHNYFVGRMGLLAHDVMVRQPTTALLPGYVPLHEPTLANH